MDVLCDPWWPTNTHVQASRAPMMAARDGKYLVFEPPLRTGNPILIFADVGTRSLFTNYILRIASAQNFQFLKNDLHQAVVLFLLN